MSAAPTRLKAPTTAVVTPAQPASIAAVVISASGRLCLDEAWAHLAACCDALNGWYVRCTGEGHSYVADGHEAIRLIDAATQELGRVRAAIVGEIRADEDERAARVDRLIAELRAHRAGNLPDDGQRSRDGGVA